ncbi:unnamed protein product, partial [Allacma fusca]
LRGTDTRTNNNTWLKLQAIISGSLKESQILHMQRVLIARDLGE